jgi:hypothetical protein
MDYKPCHTRENAIVAQKGFEKFVRSAYKTWSTERLWLRHYVLYDLVMAENGNFFIKVDINKQISEVQKYLKRAFDLYLNQNINKDIKNQLEHLENQAIECKSSDGFIEIIDEATKLTQPFVKVDVFRQTV